MKTVVIIYMIVSSIFSLGSLIYVGTDWVYEKIKENRNPAPAPVPVPVPVPIPEPEPEPEPEPVVIPVVEEVDAEEADELISDDVAMSTVIYEDETEPDGYKTFVNIGTICQVFEAGDVVDLPALKEKKLVPAKTKRLKVLADGILNKPLTIKANQYSVQAIKMIELTGGVVVIRKVRQ